jgi:hypothetical protein
VSTLDNPKKEAKRRFLVARHLAGLPDWDAFEKACARDESQAG